jgi:hypothetical protein
LALPVGAFVLWQAIVGARWGVLPVLAGPPNFGLPFMGLGKFLVSLRLTNFVEGVWLLEFLYLAGLAILAAVAFGKSPAWQAKLAWLGYWALLLLLSGKVWVEDLAFMRAATEFGVFSFVLVLSAGRQRGVAALLVMTASLGLLVFVTRLDWMGIH